MGSQPEITALASPPPQVGWQHRLKLAAFCLAPAMLLLLAAECCLRIVVPLPEIVPFTREVYEDRDLFWRVRPNLDERCQRGDARLQTNSLGFRDREVGPKPEGEFRVLCLGESTTYGDYVEFHQTYAQVAQRQLRRRHPDAPVRVINAGAPSYSSFQSLILLEKYGMDLSPDVVVLYHEGNDYLPVGWDSASIGRVTDPERYNIVQARPWLWALTRLRVLRDPAVWWFREPPPPEVNNAVYSRFGTRLPGVKTRLTREQQTEVLGRFHRLCHGAGVDLVLIHPTYSQTQPHHCPLTDFAQRFDVPLIATYNLFARTGRNWRVRLFADPAHPKPEGHRLIGEALAERLARDHRLTTPAAVGEERIIKKPTKTP